MYVANEEPEELKSAEKGVKLLRIDHSKVYFENGRLTEMLNANLSELNAHKHRQWMAHTSEIKDIRQTLEDYKTIIKSQARSNPNLRRPQTSSAYLSRRKRTPTPGTVPCRVTPNVKVNDEKLDSDSDDSAFLDDDPFRNPRTKSAPVRQQRNSIISVNSTTSRRSDASLVPNVLLSQHASGRQSSKMLTPDIRQPANIRSESRFSRRTASSTPSLRRTSVTSAWQAEDMTSHIPSDDEESRRMQILCGSNKTLSRRELKQLTNVDRFIDDGRKRRSARYQEAVKRNMQEKIQLENKVKEFLKSLMNRNNELKIPSRYSKYRVAFV